MKPAPYASQACCAIPYSKSIIIAVSWRCETHPLNGARGECILAHVDRVTLDPADADKTDIDRLLAAGLTPRAVVSLSQLIAYVNFQSRVLAGLRMLKGAA